MGLRKQIEQLRPGEKHATMQSRSAVYMAAKRAGVEVTTAESDGIITITRKGEFVPDLSLADRVAALSPKDRLELFERFELCCGMNRGGCVCDSEQLYAQLESAIPNLSVETGSEPDWIEDPQTFENGEILYWHHKPKCKPVCYRRESDPSAC